MQNEEWRDVPFAPSYQVSNLGNFRHWRWSRWKYPKVVRQTTGYGHIGFYRGTKGRLCLAHRVVWESFVGSIQNGKEINHKNGDKMDNRLENLEVVSRSENNIHALMTLHRKRNLTPDDVRRVRRLRGDGKTMRQIASIVGKTHQSIQAILKGKTWTFLK